VVYFNPADSDYPIGFNPLARVESDRRPLMASAIVDALHSLWPDSWGPQLEMFLQAACAALLEARNATLPGISLLLTDPGYRASVLRQVGDLGVRNFWERDFVHMPEREQRERSLSTLNKIGQFLNDFRLRNILGQPQGGLDIDAVLAERKVFIANLAQGQLGIGKSRLLGALLIVSFHMAALRRRERTPFHLVVDEFHSFGNATFAEMLSGARKFGLSLTLAHQYLEQLGDTLKAALIGTVGTIVSFRIGVRDAEILAPELDRKLSDLTGLAAHRALVRTGDVTVELNMPPLAAKIFPSASRRIQNRCRNELAVPRAVAERRVASLFGSAPMCSRHRR
jgi:hypothetical protein